MSEWKSDPHVVSLRYTLEDNERVRFENPPAVQFENGLAEFKLEGETLTCTMKQHFADANVARRAVRPVLEGWDALAQLSGHPVGFTFKFADAQVIERNPSPSDTATGLAVLMAGSSRASGSLSVHRNLTSYPAPPTAFI